MVHARQYLKGVDIKIRAINPKSSQQIKTRGKVSKVMSEVFALEKVECKDMKHILHNKSTRTLISNIKKGKWWTYKSIKHMTKNKTGLEQ